MAGRHKAYQVTLDDQEHQALERVVAVHINGQTEVQRAQVVLTTAAHSEWSDARVA